MKKKWAQYKVVWELRMPLRQQLRRERFAYAQNVYPHEVSVKFQQIYCSHYFLPFNLNPLLKVLIKDVKLTIALAMPAFVRVSETWGADERSLNSHLFCSPVLIWSFYYSCLGFFATADFLLMEGMYLNHQCESPHLLGEKPLALLKFSQLMLDQN